MPAYWVARAKVNDPAEYKKYADRVPAIFAKYGAKVLTRGGHAVGVQEVRGPRARDLREVRREGAHARRELSDPRGLGEIQPLRRHRVPDLRAGRRLLLFTGVQGGGGVSPQEQGGRERARDDRGGRKRGEGSCPASSMG